MPPCRIKVTISSPNGGDDRPQKIAESQSEIHGEHNPFHASIEQAEYGVFYSIFYLIVN